VVCGRLQRQVGVGPASRGVLVGAGLATLQHRMSARRSGNEGEVWRRCCSFDTGPPSFRRRVDVGPESGPVLVTIPALSRSRRRDATRAAGRGEGNRRPAPGAPSSTSCGDGWSELWPRRVWQPALAAGGVRGRGAVAVAVAGRVDGAAGPLEGGGDAEDSSGGTSLLQTRPFPGPDSRGDWQ
jgi:hypothetical protein